jgi:hypothetical protein
MLLLYSQERYPEVMIMKDVKHALKGAGEDVKAAVGGSAKSVLNAAKESVKALKGSEKVSEE